MVWAPPGPTLVVAGAGSGKTRALTSRVARLLRDGARPESILLATFTNRAAREMCARVEALAGKGTRGMWAGTFHHVAARALRRWGPRLGLDPGFGLLDRDDARELLGRCLEDEGARGLPQPAPLLRVLSLAAGGGLTVEQALARHAPRFVSAAAATTRIADRFQREKARLGLLDFDDLLAYFQLLLVELDDVRAEIEGEIAHVLVDEYQDASPLQAELMERCAAGSGDLMVVGDDAQSIYRFRGADVALLLDFPRRHPSARVLRLETNYRSTPEIVALANRSIAGNRRRLDKTLRAVRPSGMTPAAVPLADAGEEARFVAERVRELHASGRPLDDMAVLYRAHAHAVELELELARAAIPYVVRSGPRLFEQAHVRDAIALLRALATPRDGLAWRRVCRQLPGIGARTSAVIVEAVTGGGIAALSDPRLAASLPKSARPSLGALANLVDELVEAGPGPGAILRRAIALHLRAHAERSFPDAEARLDDLAQLALYGDRYPALAPFLTDLALVASVKAEAVRADGVPDGEGALTLSTIHQAKGLEWDCVFVVHLSEGSFPPGVATRGSPEEEEERRLFYVAVTRARDELHLCHPEHAVTQGGMRVRLLPSRFLVELEGDGAAPVVARWRVSPGA